MNNAIQLSKIGDFIKILKSWQCKQSIHCPGITTPTLGKHSNEDACRKPACNVSAFTP